MKKGSVLLLTFLLFVFTGCGEKESGKTPGAGMTVFTDTGMMFSIEYPSTWSKDTKSNRAGFFSPDDQAAIFVTKYSNIPPDVSIEEIFDKMIVQPYSKPESFGIAENIMDEEDCAWSLEIAEDAGAESGYGGIFKGQVSGRSILMMVAVLKKGTTAYQILTYAEATRFEKYQDIIQNAFASFKINK